MAATQSMHTLREARMRGVLLASIAFGLVASSAAAQDRKGIQFWNGAQAASAPDALATWVAIASIKAGERQS